MRSPVLALSLLAPLVAACSAPLASPGADSFLRDAAEGASSAALIVFERTATADDNAHGSAVARFIRMRSGFVDDQTLRMVGATLDLPGLGTCGAIAALPTTADSVSIDGLGADESDGPRAVELLDVGGVAVEANGARATLEARALPDIVDLVTGVLYSTRTAFDSDGLPSRGAYLLRSSGSSSVADGDHAVPPFTVSATAPGEPEELRIDGQDARGADGVALTAGARVELAWGVKEGSDPEDVVYVDLVSATDAQQGPGVRCAFADRGSASIPAAAFAVGAAEMARGTLVVHRIHRETFQVPAPVEPSAGRTGIEAGVVRFDFARSLEFTRR